MVKEIIKNKNKYYQCEVCKFYYLEKDLAQKCEAHCKKTNSCSIEITKSAVQT